MLIRVQLILDQQIKKDLAKVALGEGISVSRLVRKYLHEKIEAEKKKINYIQNEGAKEFLRMAQRARKLPSNSPGDLSVNVDYYLYGAHKRQVNQVHDG